MRFDLRDARLEERLARQIEASHSGVLIEVAEDIGELQGAPEMMGKRKPRIPLHPEDMNAESPNRAGDAVAVEVEGGEIGSADGRHDVHFHPIDDGQKIPAAEIEGR